jgi:hypothetical protein
MTFRIALGILTFSLYLFLFTFQQAPVQEASSPTAPTPTGVKLSYH